MKITFDIPHVFRPGSNPEEDSYVKASLKNCLQTITRGSVKTSVVPTLKRTGKTQVTFDLPSVFQSDSNPVDNAKALQSLLHCLCDIDEEFLKHRWGTVPLLYDSGVIYDRTQVWDSTPALYARGYGDCKSLACARVAELRVMGEFAIPVFRWLADGDGQTNYHILNQTDYEFEDPSKVCGMGQNENAYFKKTG
jgi:hypothetical protein